MKKTARRDWRAFGVLYSMTSPRVFGLILHMTDYSEACEDLLQDVYIKVWNQADRFEPKKGKVTTWITSIARNCTIDWMRSQGTGMERLTSERDPDTLDLAGGVDPAEVPDQVDRDSGLAVCMDQLSSEQRQAIFLAYHKGHSHSELVERLGSPLGTVKSWVRRGLETLRDCLQRLGGTP